MLFFPMCVFPLMIVKGWITVSSPIVTVVSINVVSGLIIVTPLVKCLLFVFLYIAAFVFAKSCLELIPIT